MAFQTQCPHCGKVLNLKSEAAVGRKAPCPKCRTPFVVEPYEEPPADEWEEAGDEYDYSDAVDDYEIESVPPRKSSSKGRKKAAGAPAWLAPVCIGLAVLLGLGLLGGGVAFLDTRSSEDASGGGTSISSKDPEAVPHKATTGQADSDSNDSPATPQDPIADLTEPSTGYVPGGADAAAQADIDALQKEKAGVLDTTNDIRSRIKSGTGSILDSVPGKR